MAPAARMSTSALGSTSSTCGTQLRKCAARAAPRVPHTRRAAVHVRAESTATEEEFDARQFRRGLNKSGRYIRRTTNDEKSINLMDEHGVGYSRGTRPVTIYIPGQGTHSHRESKLLVGVFWHCTRMGSQELKVASFSVVCSWACGSNA